MGKRESFTIATRGRGTQDITSDVAEIVQRADVEEGLCTIFCHHTSASLILCENADPQVRADLEGWLSRAVQDGDEIFEHTAEGKDDMAAHVRTILTSNSLGVPVAGGSLDLGTWQGIYLYEHRYRDHRRRITVVVTSV